MKSRVLFSPAKKKRKIFPANFRLISFGNDELFSIVMDGQGSFMKVLVGVFRSVSIYLSRSLNRSNFVILYFALNWETVY